MSNYKDLELKITYLKEDQITPYINNTRTHSRIQIEQVKASIAEFGMCSPIGIHEGVIVYGHARFQALKELKYSKFPCLDLSHLTESQRKAYVIADNQLAANAGWDLDLLKVELEGLEEMDFDIDLLGFDEDFLGDLLQDDESEEGLTDEDETPEPPENPVSVLGDIWQLSNHRLMCGDSTSIDAVELLLDGKKADMVHTDPPYGVSYQSNMRTKTDKFEIIKNDDVFLDIAPVIDACSNGWVFVWTSWKVLTTWIDAFNGFGYPTNQVIWFKGGGGIGDLKKTFSSDYETALVWHRGAELTGKRIGSVWKVDKDASASYVHPTQKPVALPEEAIDKTTRRKNIVLDLFGGSGSTLIACEKLDRQARIMELDEKYIDVIILRWQDYTGKQAIHTESGKTYSELKLEQDKK